MQHVVLWSAMRSGSTEFAKELAHENMWTFADEPFNPRLSKYNPSITTPTRLIFKVFPKHHRERLHGTHCNVVLERPVSNRWCSFIHARQSGEWSGRRRWNCEARPPKWFETQHRHWFKIVPRQHLYLTFDNVTLNRTWALRSVQRYCDRTSQTRKIHRLK